MHKWWEPSPLNDEVKEMYDGYQFGGIEIYNPWSIINYAQRRVLESYWVNTSSNTMIKDTILNRDASFQEGYETLIEQGYLDTQVSLDTSFYEVNENRYLWGLFVNAGYLTLEKSLPFHRSRIRIPNKEVEEAFINLTAHYLKVPDGTLMDMFAALLEKRFEEFLKYYRFILLDYPSYHDLKSENSYHTLLLGMSIILRSEYEILSNREMGHGRNDLMLKAKLPNLPSFIIELKYTNDAKANLLKLANEAIEQIKSRKYDHELSGEVIYIGLAHFGKVAEMKWETQSKVVE